MYGEEFVMDRKSISNKAKKSGMPYSILKKVYDQRNGRLERWT